MPAALRTVLAGFLVPVAACFAESAPLTAEQMASAVQLDALSIPAPGEFFAAVNDVDRPNWSRLNRSAVIPNSSNRAQIALDLGTRVADGFIAVEAQDGQQVKNVGKDIIALAKSLGVTESILARGNSISDFADNNEWSALKEELEATENEVKNRMAEQKDDELVTLVTVGAWIRGTQAASEVVAENYQPSSAQLLRQSAILDFLMRKVDALSERTRKDPFVVKVRGGLGEIGGIMTVAPESAPSKEQVDKLREITTALVQEISGVSDKPKP